MRRKIILHGPSSMTISLPSAWVKEHNIKKGEEVEVCEEDECLMIKPLHSTSDLKTTQISFIGLDRDTRKDLILALHKKGYDEIRIDIDNPVITKELHAFLSDMQLGFEIIRQESDAITIRNISNPESEQFDNLFRRVFRITIEYSKKIEAIIDRREEITNSCLLHETSINRISNYCKRIIIKEKKQNACFLYAIIEELGIIAHNLTNLLTEIKNLNKISKTFLIKYTEVTDILMQVHNLYYKFSMKDYSVIKRYSQNLKKQIEEIKSKDQTCGWDYLEAIHAGIETLLESTLSAQF